MNYCILPEVLTSLDKSVLHNLPHGRKISFLWPQVLNASSTELIIDSQKYAPHISNSTLGYSVSLSGELSFITRK